jgi:hypothetical protein
MRLAPRDLGGVNHTSNRMKRLAKCPMDDGKEKRKHFLLNIYNKLPVIQDIYGEEWSVIVNINLLDA